MKKYLDRYKEAASFFEMTQSEKDKIIKERALMLLSPKVKKLLDIKENKGECNER